MKIGYPLHYNRLRTRVVRIGNLLIGGSHPILVQSMLSTPATNISACFKEIISLVKVGCQLIRITIPSSADLDAIPEIKRLMKEEGMNVPLSADIHFSPKLAIQSCELFEKVRINPGNFSDTPKNAAKKDADQAFNEGYDLLKEAALPLVQNLKKYNRSLRIGVNHGSLSQRMMERYGDSPMGMVQSALEMIEILESYDYDQIVVSLKSSNPIVVQRAYRLLAQLQTSEEKVPLHLGVTEAGSGEMARIKSMAGIGVLLADGLGDTIRVSLTEASHFEIPFAEQLLKDIPTEQPDKAEKTNTVWNRPLNHQGLLNPVMGDQLIVGSESGHLLPASDTDFETDIHYLKNKSDFSLDGSNQPLAYVSQVISESHSDLSNRYDGLIFDLKDPIRSLRAYHSRIEDTPEKLPIGVLLPSGHEHNCRQKEIEIACHLSEGLLNFVLIPSDITPEQYQRTLLLLQAVRARTIMTDYIACPSCGRTLFNLEKTTEDIKEATKHLKGLKIGIMGCIVNGPGEMADADFGYVGSGPGKIDLYEGQTRVKRGIPEEKALEALIELIKQKGRWV